MAEVAAAAVRRRVMETASGIWFSAGAGAVTMDRIAADLGMSKKTLYKLYRSKQDLWRDVVTAVFSEVEKENAVPKPSNSPTLKALPGLRTRRRRDVPPRSASLIGPAV